jgi:dTDP-4-amino-4,6-dideoxygalactose transaminase
LTHSEDTVPLFDITGQHAPLRQELRQAVLKVLDSCHYVLGEEGSSFENEFANALGSRHAVGVSSGTSALHLAITALGVGPGDGVLTIPMTFIGTTIGILAAGARIQFADIDPATMTMDPRDAAQRIRSDTKVLLPVHLYGYPAEMDALLALAKQKGLRVVEDCAQAHLTEYKGEKVGNFGDIGCFSFYVSKNLGAAGDAGACVTQDKGLDQKLRTLRNNGSDPRERYRHILKGYNARMDEIQAAVLRVKLRRLARWTEERRQRAALYRELLSDLPLQLPPAEGKGILHTYHLFIVRVKKRDRLRRHLADAGIATGVYYPIPLHLQPAYKDLGYRKGQFPQAEKACQEVLALPVSPEISLGKIRRVAGEIRSFFGRA